MPVNGSNKTYVTSTNSSGIKITWDGSSSKGTNAGTVFNLKANQFPNAGFVASNGQILFGSYDNKYCASKQSNSVYGFSGSGHVRAVASGNHGVAGIAMVGKLIYWVEPCTKSLQVSVQSRNGQLSE